MSDDLHTKPSAAIRVCKDIVFGSIAGMASKVFEHPFDLTKVRLQAQLLTAAPVSNAAGASHVVHFRGPLHCLLYTHANEGFRGLYRGLPAPIVGSMVEDAILFLAYGALQNGIRSMKGKSANAELNTAEMTVAGAGAGAIISFVLTPIELIKCKMQVQMLGHSPKSTSKPPGPISLVLQTLHTAGLRGLWLGQTGTLIRETGGSAIWFGTKEAVAKFLIKSSPRQPSSRLAQPATRPLEVWESAVSGGVAGLMCNVAFYPADTVKSAIQTARRSSPPLSFLSTFTQIFRTSGLRGLYAGCGITILQSVPSSAMVFVIWDGLNRRFG